MRIKPKLDELKRKYGDDKQRYSQEMQKLYQEENISMGGGCLPTLIRLPIMFSIYYLITQPLTYLMKIPADVINSVTEALKLEGGNYTRELTIIDAVAKDPSVSPEIANKLGMMDFTLFGLDLTQTPKFSINIFANFDPIWFIPLAAFAAQMLTSVVTMQMQKKINPDAPNMTGMMLTMPLISLFIGFTVPAGVGFYWACSSLISGFIQTGIQYFYGPQKMLAHERAKEIIKVYEEEQKYISKRVIDDSDKQKEGITLIKEYIGEGKDIKEATEAAKTGLIAENNLKDEDDILFDVVNSTYKPKVLGLFGGAMVQVKAYIELPDPKPEKKKVEKKAAKPETKAEAPAKKEEKKPEVKEAKKEDKPELTLIPAEQLEKGSSAAKAAEYIKTVMTGLGCENVTVSAAEVDGAIYLQLDGEKLGVVIGRRGETLDALQYLTSLAANTGNGYQKVTLNIGNYREKREQTLTSLAKRVSAQVANSGRSRTLEPMNPYERRIIHTAVQEIEGVVSASVGEGTGRRVVISPEGGDRRPPRRDDRRGGRRGDRKPSQTVAATADPNRAPKKDAPDLPLYGRIN